MHTVLSELILVVWDHRGRASCHRSRARAIGVGFGAGSKYLNLQQHSSSIMEELRSLVDNPLLWSKRLKGSLL